ncbi:hypothetical protein H2201_002275 [Coniosporium apollinis]|uniref:NADH dehydrogenase [ubiquinone] 1 alpha subcomplex subunit n=1 Tax=Coniosporium apollinis TaxID=61459 RepID=A0ABQ9NZE2_9PEZI|nr:hypothetical protein H2201_002275 [Coniosporium apollinis]
MPSGPGTIKQWWYRWKSLRLPWRKTWLCGSDLAGNTFWEFKDAMNANRVRRIVRYNPRAHYADVKMAPQWIQWLRHTRYDPPSIAEQQLDEIRQHQMKELAAAADQRWASKSSALDPPSKQQPLLPLRPRDPAGDAPQTEPEQNEGVTNMAASPEEVVKSAEGEDVDKGRFKGETREPPWKGEKAAPQEEYKSWTPSAAKRRS